jgi:CcdB protein
MRQFDICRMKAPASQAKSKAPLVIILQSNLTSDLATRVVAPLVPETDLPAIGAMRPSISFQGRKFRLIVDRLSVVSTASIGEALGTAANKTYDIRRALDIVFVGV